jgi:UDP-N-acetylmuramate: L-alanyl-gamma-D-glutamyl-meso-diaminopimelate ligase
MKIHLIAIGGSAMHNLALALHEKGYVITGSDDEIFEPSRSRLEKAGLLPKQYGWFPEKITPDLDAVILGMHATDDNPELIKARKIGLTIYSYPEYLYEQTKNKKRIVVAGSHGKTTLTSMVMHVLKVCNRDFDYMVGAIVEGFETMVRLSDSASYAIFEGDEYLSSVLDKRPKFHLYKPHIAVITGVAWDHVNVFPTFDIYKEQFVQFINLMEPSGCLYYYSGDPVLEEIVTKSTNNTCKIPYSSHECNINDHITYLATQTGLYRLNIFGDHNLQNISGAKNICTQLGITDVEFYKAISSFKGASKRQQILKSRENAGVYLDFAHAPSKVKATVNAFRSQYPERKLVTCLELHSFSSLTAEFLSQYKNTLDDSDISMVYYNPETVKHKRLPEIKPEQIQQAFGNKNLKVFTDTDSLLKQIKLIKEEQVNFLFMSSGNFGGIDLTALAREII